MENNELSTQPSRMEKLANIEIRNGLLQITNFEDAVRVAQMFANSTIGQPDWKTSDRIGIVLHGIELKLSPIQALQSSYIVNGRIALFGEAPKALVEASGLLEDYSEKYTGKPFDDDYAAVVTVKRKGRTVSVSEWSVSDAKIANLWGKSRLKNGQEVSPWVLYPKDMLMARARGRALKTNFADVLRGTEIREIGDDNEPGFEHALPAKVVEPNFQTKTEKPFQEAEKLREKFPQIKEEVRNATQPESDADLKKRAKADLEEAVTNGKKRAEENVMRPVRSETGPPPAPVATAPVEAPEPPTKPVAPPKPPKPPKQAPPATDEQTRYWKLHSKLAEEGISHDKFMRVMHSFGLLPEGIEPDDFPDGIPLDKLDDKAIDLASKNWKQVLEEIAKL